jgi:hypothetical protein
VGTYSWKDPRKNSRRSTDVLGKKAKGTMKMKIRMHAVKHDVYHAFSCQS